MFKGSVIIKAFSQQIYNYNVIDTKNQNSSYINPEKYYELDSIDLLSPRHTLRWVEKNTIETKESEYKIIGADLAKEDDKTVNSTPSTTKEDINV